MASAKKMWAMVLMTAGAALTLIGKAVEAFPDDSGGGELPKEREQLRVVKKTNGGGQ